MTTIRYKWSCAGTISSSPSDWHPPYESFRAFKRSIWGVRELKMRVSAEEIIRQIPLGFARRIAVPQHGFIAAGLHLLRYDGTEQQDTVVKPHERY